MKKIIQLVNCLALSLLTGCAVLSKPIVDLTILNNTPLTIMDSTVSWGDSGFHFGYLGDRGSKTCLDFPFSKINVVTVNLTTDTGIKLQYTTNVGKIFDGKHSGEVELIINTNEVTPIFKARLIPNN